MLLKFPGKMEKLSAAGQTRTVDHLVNSQALYLLSYGGAVGKLCSEINEVKL